MTPPRADCKFFTPASPGSSPTPAAGAHECFGVVVDGSGSEIWCKGYNLDSEARSLNFKLKISGVIKVGLRFESLGSGFWVFGFRGLDFPKAQCLCFCA